MIEFFSSGRLLRQWNHSVIALVPKKTAASIVHEYRPISCCTVFYKLISKILVDRLRGLLGDIVNEAQAAFVQGHSIVDYIHSAQELMRKYARKRGSPRCILQVDIHKAYDTVDWDFLHEVLNSLNFPPRFIQWIIECVATTSYSIAINGHYHGKFDGKRGLRQGDPLSPLLFSLCLEVLSRSLKRMSASPEFVFHPKCGNLRITHLAYADDDVNLSRQLRASEFSVFVDSLASKCVIDSINSICRKFVWPTKYPPIAWHELCKPLTDGGFGLKNLKAWNRALLAKKLWKIHAMKDCPWIKWKWRKDTSPLLKHIIDIREEMIREYGLIGAASSQLDSWFGTTGGISCAYEFFARAKGNWPWKPLISKSCVLPKHRFVLWLMAHRKLQTRDILGYVQDRKCVLCKLEDESIAHLFYECLCTKIIWDRIRKWLGMKKCMRSPSAILCAFRSVYRGNSNIARLRFTAMAATVYHVWTMRNRVMFDGENLQVDDIVRKIQIHSYRCLPQVVETMCVLP
ncbi:uncharacterized protein [Primulina eburnea]|uniref:uncharacterized protein n=1 Tax=Primulina eburnea TaxID=1245227 RepID=UPI003C6BEDD1